MDSVCAHESCCLGAQAVVAHRHGHVSRSAASIYFCRREIAFGAYKDAYVGARTVCFCEECARGICIAVAHKLLCLGGFFGKEGLQWRGVVDLREYSF